MMNSDYLNVWYGTVLVGRLWRDATGHIGFQYEKNWVDNGFAISQQLPLNNDEYTPNEGHAHQFFANLLPEADARMHIVRDLKIANSDFELLKAIGGECAGALSILPTNNEASDIPHYQQLSRDDLKKLLLRKGNISSFIIEGERPRLSLAGAQDKAPIFFDGKDYFIPHDASPSSHILKFEIMGYRNIPAYEYFLTKLAESIGLPTVECYFKTYDKHHYLLIKRYDRVVIDDKKIQRLHQEDFCQALGVRYEKKYQESGGPSFQDCYRLIQQVSTQPIIDADHLLKWQMFNLIAGNSDGHAKNLALIYQQGAQIVLAPFYDLVCTRAIERIDTKLAMSVGGEFNPDRITMRHWAQLAKECNIREDFIAKTLRQMASSLLENVIVIREQFEREHGAYPALQRVQVVVTKQCKKRIKELLN